MMVVLVLAYICCGTPIGMTEKALEACGKFDEDEDDLELETGTPPLPESIELVSMITSVGSFLPPFMFLLPAAISTSRFVSFTTIVVLLLLVEMFLMDEFLCLEFSLSLLSTSASGSSGLISSISELLSRATASSSDEKINGQKHSIATLVNTRTC